MIAGWRSRRNARLPDVCTEDMLCIGNARSACCVRRCRKLCTSLSTFQSWNRRGVLKHRPSAVVATLLEVVEAAAANRELAVLGCRSRSAGTGIGGNEMRYSSLSRT